MKKSFFLFDNIRAAGKNAMGLNGRRGVGLWLIIHLGIPLLLGLSLFWFGPVRINTNLYGIIPGSSQAGAADMLLGDTSSRQAIILAAAEDFESAKAGAALVYGKFENSPAFETLSLYYDAGLMARFIEYLYDYRFVIAGRETLALLESGRAGNIAEDALAAAFGAFTFAPLDNIEGDPFLLTERRLEEFLSSSLLSGGALELKDHVLAARKDGSWYVLLRGALAPASVSMTNSKSAVKEIYEVASAAKALSPGLEFYFSGVPFHSYESSSGAQREISIISTLTLLIILLLFLYIFRSPLPVLLSVLAAGVSIALAAASALLVFREIHIITFVFGTTLIGTSVDYSVHFFVHWNGNRSLKSGGEIRSYIAKSISMSFISTELCFFVFLFTPFAILRQFAVFSMVGLLSSFLSSLCLYPCLKIPPEEKRRFAFLEKRFFPIPMQQAPKIRLSLRVRAGIVAVLAVCALAVLFLFRSGIKIENNLSSLYTMPEFLLESEKRAAGVLDHGSPGWYFIVSGSSLEETLEREEMLGARLEAEIARGTLRSFLATSVFIPSISLQQRNYQAMEALLPLAETQFESLGMPPEYADAFRGEFAAAAGRFCLPGEAPPHVKEIIANLWIGETGGNFYSCVLPLHPSEEPVFRAIAGEFDFVHFVNKVKDIGGDLDALTRTMLILFLVAYLGISVLVCFVYPLKESLKICAVPFFLILVTGAALAANRIPPGFFSAAALVLVFGLGLDYIFYMSGTPAALTRLGVVLSFVTTFLSFGALALSTFAPVHIFGLTVFAGLGAAFVSAMLLSGGEP